jgi:putative ABC transport system permease protein
MDKFVNSLPKWAERFLRSVCPDELFEEIEGDLIQQFNSNTKTVGRRKSSIMLFFTVIRFLRPGIFFRKRFKIGFSRFDLLTYNLSLAFRQLRRNRLFSFINIIGLSISIAAVLIIAQYAGFHFNFDRYHKDFSSKFRIYSKNLEGNKISIESALTSYKLASLLKKEFPEVRSVTQLMPTDSWFDCVLRYDSENGAVIHNEHKLFFADNQFFDTFTSSVIAGNLDNALSDPNSVVLTKSAASRYFRNTSPLGKVLHLNGSFESNDYLVTAIIEDFPLNTHLDIDILMSLNSLEEKRDLGNSDFYTYVTLHRDADAVFFESKMSALSEHFILDGAQRLEHSVQSISEIHLHSHMQDEMKLGGDFNTISSLIIIGLVILIIAWINYVNLSMSRIFGRVREVGIRKVNGATKTSIIGQFFTEAVVVNFLSILIAVVLVELTTPALQSLTGREFTWTEFANMSWRNPLVYIVLLLVTGIATSANFPSAKLASTNPVHVLKGEILAFKRKNVAGNALITFQFTCSIVLLITVSVMHSQHSFMQNTKLGVEIDRTLVVKAPTNTDSTYANRFTTFKNYAADNLYLQNISTSTSVPGQEIEWTGRVSNPISQESRTVHIQVADTAYFQTYSVKVLSGRNFSISDYPGEQFGGKTEAVILNNKAVEVLGFSSEEDALGRTIYWGNNKCTIVGIVANYHQQSLRHGFKPILYTANAGPLMSFKLTETFEKDFHNSISGLETAWKKFFPDDAFDFFYLPDLYSRNYRSERNLGAVIDIFSCLALITSCLGLLGLSAFAAKQKVKETSIRKILGADWLGIVIVLSKNFIILISVAALIAVPLAILQCGHWLNGYAFHIDLQIWHFVAPIGVVVSISLLTVLSQCVKVARNNPAKLLRSE